MDEEWVHHCLAGCGRRITWRFAICSECEKTYGRSPKDWPEWLAFLWRDIQRQRRQTTRIMQHEVTFTDLPEDLMTDDRQGDDLPDEER